jgi:hypothetical protein
MSTIFFKSKHYLFHTYAMFNLTHAVRRNKTWSEEQKAGLMGKFVLAALSVPLNHRLQNFERLSNHYMPKDMQEDAENSTKIRSEVLEVANMLYITGIPSRQSLINEINLKNMMNVVGCPEIATLFKLIEQEESPFAISKKGPAALKKAIETYPKELAQYEANVKKTLAIRIL